MSPKHGGNLEDLARRAGVRRDELLDFSANINPCGYPEWLRRLVARHLHELAAYPDPGSTRLRGLIAAHHRVAPEQVLVTSGAGEFLSLLPAARATGGYDRAVIASPGYTEYAAACRAWSYAAHEPPVFTPGAAADPGALHTALAGATGIQSAERGSDAGDTLCFIGRPNNPTGHTVSPADLRRLMDGAPEAFFCIDESFWWCIEDFDSADSLVDTGRVAVVRSLTKAYAIPGLRLGYAICPPAVAAAVGRLIPPWSVNRLAQLVGERALHDESFLTDSRRTLRSASTRLVQDLRRLDGVTVYPAETNFLLLELPPPWRGTTLLDALLERGIAVRTCTDFAGLNDSIVRIAVRSEEENTRLVDALAETLSHKRRGPGAPRATGDKGRGRPTPAIMVQGTSSNAGKSLMATALCRILSDAGYRVAPFKAQNMSLNSAVTADEREIGRAQALQALACRREADVRMNPVLLKPSAGYGSQVVILGTPHGHMKAREYEEFKPTLRRRVCDAYDSLADEADVVILEGAGSPGEVNLKSGDIVNMAMARHAGAPVLLVGDIDRGGVYASFVGTMEVLAEWERRLVAGFLVNKFRGDASLLEDAHTWMEEHTGRRVIGVVPYMEDHGLPEEDSVTFAERLRGRDRVQSAPEADARLRIVILALDHISNFTDFDPLIQEPDVEVVFARDPEAVGEADAVLLPGSKSVIHDLRELRRRGFEDPLRRHLSRHAQGTGAVVVGLCGGFQMLGNELRDPKRVESPEGRQAGLGFLDLSTTLARQKTLTRTQALHAPSGVTVTGYEIHHGHTEGRRGVPVFTGADRGRGGGGAGHHRGGDLLGYATEDGQVWGTYLHGVFDNNDFRRWFLNTLRRRRGWSSADRGTRYDVDAAVQRFADAVKAHINLDEILRISGLA